MPRHHHHNSISGQVAAPEQSDPNQGVRNLGGSHGCKEPTKAGMAAHRGDKLLQPVTVTASSSRDVPVEPSAQVDQSGKECGPKRIVKFSEEDVRNMNVKLGVATYSETSKYAGVSGRTLIDIEGLPPDSTAWNNTDDECPHKPLMGTDDCGYCWPVIYFQAHCETCYRASCYYQLQDDPMVAWPINLGLDPMYIGILDDAEAEDGSPGVAPLADA